MVIIITYANLSVLSVELPSGLADIELPSGLTTLLSLSDLSMEEPRNSTAVTQTSDPRNYFDGEILEEIELSLLGVLCECGKLLSK